VSALWARGAQLSENKARFLFQQLISGVSIASYWAATYAWDMANFMLPFAAFLILMRAFDVTDLISGEAGAATAALLLTYGLSIAPFTYILSYCCAIRSTNFVANLQRRCTNATSYVATILVTFSISNIGSYLRWRPSYC
jgi:hypothetical protein